MNVLDEVAEERRRQDAKWGQQNHLNGTSSDSVWAAWITPLEELGPAGIQSREAARRLCDSRFRQGSGTWLDILLEEVAEAFAEDDVRGLRVELIQVAAVTVAWVEAIDRAAADG